MFKAESPALVCSSCGHRNPAREKFCLACAARLGREPSIARPAQRVAEPSAHSGFDAPRTVHSQPAALRAAPVDASSFWFKFCMAGLVVMIGFLGWALYVMTGSKAVAPLPAAPAAPATSAAPVPEAPVASTLAPLPTPAPAPKPTRAPAVSAAAPAASAPAPRPAAIPAPAARARPAEPRRAAAVAPRPAQDERVETFERPRQPDMSWQQRALPYEQPSYAPRPMPSQQAVMPAPDAGPPIVVGPGPLYDYSTPGAVRR